MNLALPFDGACHQCGRLSNFLAQVRRKHPGYFAAPVPSFGDAAASLLIVGLAPGMHGANRTGRPFTGDHAGILLYETLHRHGFGSQPDSIAADDPLTLSGCRITNAVRCLPPANKPLPAEVNACAPYLAWELTAQPSPRVVLALGRVAHQAVLKALGGRLADYPFVHGGLHDLPGGQKLLSSYHCSRYNTQTRRLTPEMFERVISQARTLVDQAVRQG